MHTCTNTRMCALVAADAETLPLCSGHGVPDAVIDDHFKASAEMFAQLTQDEKQMLKVNAPPAATLASTSAAKETKVQGFPRRLRALQYAYTPVCLSYSSICLPTKTVQVAAGTWRAPSSEFYQFRRLGCGQRAGLDSQHDRPPSQRRGVLSKIQSLGCGRAGHRRAGIPDAGPEQLQAAG